MTTIKIISLNHYGDAAIGQFLKEQDRSYKHFMHGFLAAGWRFLLSDTTPYTYTITLPLAIQNPKKLLKSIRHTMEKNKAVENDDYTLEVRDWH